MRTPSLPRPLRLVGAAVVAAALLGLAACQGEPPPSPEFVQATNRGKAYLENKDSGRAIEAFTAAVAAAPESDRQSAAAHRNLARALLLARQHVEALAALQKAGELEEDSAATAYLTGLAHARESGFEAAIPQLERAVRLDPAAAPLRFQLANAYQAVGREADAVAQLRETVRLDPLHASAHFKLATAARLAGDPEEFALRQAEFQKLREIFGDEGRSAEALETSVYTAAEEAPRGGGRGKGKGGEAVAPSDVPVSFVAAEVSFPGREEVAAAAVLAVDPGGRPGLVAATGAGALVVYEAAEGGGWERREALPAGSLAAATRIAVGDFFNEVPEGAAYDPLVHARNDLAVVAGGAVRLVRQDEEGFREVTAAAGLAGAKAGGGEVEAVLWFDAEHDGDLDLALGGPAGTSVWFNRGDGTFGPAPADLGIAAAGPVMGFAAADFDGDVAADFLAVRGSAPTAVFANQRAGRYAALPEPPGPWTAAAAVAVDDFDGDGRPEAALAGASGVTFAGFAATAAGRIETAGPATAVAALDFDNDGRLDLALATAGGLALWRNAGPDGWVEATGATGLGTAAAPASPATQLFAVDAEGDGDTDLFVVSSTGLHLFENRGGDANRQLKLRLVGTKTNPGGIGTRVEVRAGSFFASRSVAGPAVEIGVGAHAKLDSVQTLWTNGVVDNRVDLAVDKAPKTIPEKNVPTGSCPFLYAWDGEGFRFVTDLLGNSPLGLALTREATFPADPDELVEIGGEAALAARDGRYLAEVTSEFREVIYLDEARLVAVDHPPGVEVHPTDKLMPPPFPVSELWALGHRRPLAAARGDDGLDRTAALAERDGRFAPAGVPLPPPLRGQTWPLALTLDFGPLAADRPLVLALTGWLQYGDGSTNVALSQNPGVRVVPPALAAEDASGRLHPVDAVVGMPAGKTKTILVDLAGKLPSGTRRLVLTTSFEIRWDRAALFERLADGALARHDLPPVAADLAHRGFSDLRSRAPLHPTTPDYVQVAARPPWRTTPQGWTTRFGDVLPLVGRRDGRLAIFNGGDALRLAFAAGDLPPVPAGRIRTFFFWSVGWEKDADPNNPQADTVAPLPAGADLAGGWQAEYSTRWVPREAGQPGR